MAALLRDMNRLQHMHIERERSLQELRGQLDQSKRVVTDMSASMSELQSLALRRAQAAKCGFDCMHAALAAFQDVIHKGLDDCFCINADVRTLKDAWKPMRAQRVVGVLDVADDARTLQKLIGAQVEAVANLMHTVSRGELDAVTLKGALPDGQTFRVQTLDPSTCVSISSFRNKAKKLLATTLTTALTQPSVHAMCKLLAGLRAVTRKGVGAMYAALDAAAPPSTTRITEEIAWKNAARAARRGTTWLHHVATAK